VLSRERGLDGDCATAGEVAGSISRRWPAEEVQLQFGLKIAGGAGVWLFSKASGERSISATLSWRTPPSP
jgi:hypothetical protein